MNRKYLLSAIVIAALMIVTSFSVMASTGSSIGQQQKTYVAYNPDIPTCTITYPTSESTLLVRGLMIQLKGTASDNGTVKYLNWSNAATGGSGTLYKSPIYGAANVTWQTRNNIGLLSGDNLITITVTDNRNNTAIDTITVTADNVAPTVTITTPTSNPIYYNQTGTISQLNGTASDDNGIASMTWWNNATGASGTIVDPANWDVTGITLNAGLNAIFVNATDNAGNMGRDVIYVRYAPNTLAVTITVPTSNATMTTGWHMIYLRGTATDETKVMSVVWTNSLGGSGIAYMTPQWGGASVAWQSRGNVHLLPGDNVITVTATDSAGNTATDTLTVTYTGL